MLQIFGLVVWTGVWVSQGVIFILNYQDLKEYEPFRKILIMNIVSFCAKFVNFLIIAFILYKSSRELSPTDEPKLFTELGNQQGVTVSQDNSFSNNAVSTLESIQNVEIDEEEEWEDGGFL